MDDIFKVIFKMEADASGLVKGLNEVNSKYAESNKELQKQETELQRLLDLESQLQQGRAKATSPNAIIKYNTELKNTAEQIKKVKESVENMTVVNDKVGKSAKALNEQIKGAFDATRINAVNREAKEFEKTLHASTLPPPKITNEFIRLRSELKQAKSDLIDAFGSGNQEEIQKAAQKVGGIQDRINSLNDTVRNFATGSKFKIINNLFRDIAVNIASFDFSQANEQAKQLLAVSKAMTFKEALGGIKDLGSTFLNIGKSLLRNPIFLLGAAIFAIISNFDKLKNAGGAIGATFRFIGGIVDSLKESFFFLTDAIGLTEQALQKLNEQKLTNLKAEVEQLDKLTERYIKLLKSQNQDTEKAEKERLNIIITNSLKQLDAYRALQKSRGELTEDEKKDFNDLAEKIADARTEIVVIENESLNKRRELAKKYAADIRAIFDDLDKRIKEQTTRGQSFKISTELDPGSTAQIRAEFALRKRLELEDIAETRKLALEKVKTKKDAAIVEQKIDALTKITNLNRTRELNKAIIDADSKLILEKDEIQKNANLSEVEQFIASNKLSEEEAAAERVSILIQYYNERQKLLENQLAREKAAGLSSLDSEKNLADLIIKGQEEVAKALDVQLRLILKNSLAREAEEQRHQDVMNQLQGDSESQRLFKQLEFEKKKLEILKASGKATEQELKEQSNKVEEVERTAREKRIQENIGYFEQISNAAFNATEQVINAKIKEIDKLSELQSKRVEDAKEIADKGNAELYELEQKRLEDLNKQREIFVKRQQALATIELIANTAIAVSKAAAQGGVAAAITIAAALIALTGGLIQARSIASQAAYYEGGYTGEGDPKRESKALGKKSYIYHNKEFVFNHEKTGKYRDIFEGIHRGDIDLADWKRKVAAYEQLRIGAMFQQKSDSVDMGKVEKELSYIRTAIENQSTSVNLDENGLSMRFKKIRSRNSFIKNNIGRA